VKESPTELLFEPEKVAIDSEIKLRIDKGVRYTLKLTRLPGRNVAKIAYKNKI